MNRGPRRFRLGFGWLGAALIMGQGAQPTKASEVTAFGLRHTVVSNASLAFSSSQNLYVSQLSYPHSGPDSEANQPFAVEIDLGRAESGVFISPRKTNPQSGQALEGWVFGTLGDGSEHWVGGLRGRRTDWGVYEGAVDFSALGATQYRFELYCDRYLIAHAESLPGDFVVSTYDIESYDPRFNPAHRLSDGRWASVVEFPQPTLFIVEHGFRAGGNRLLVIPQDPTNKLDYVSKIRVVGSSELPDYEIEDERLVLFGTPHRALGGAVFDVGPHGVTLRHLDGEVGSGVLIEGERSMHMSVDLDGATLSHVGEGISVASFGSSASDTYGTFLGPAGVTYENDGCRLSFEIPPSDSPSRVLVEAFLHGVPTGFDEVETDRVVGSFGAVPLTVSRLGGFGVSYTNRAGLFLTLAEPATLLTVSSNQLVGDTFVASLSEPTIRLGSIDHLIVMTSGLAEITLTDESRLLLPTDPLQMSIADVAVDRVRVEWPYLPCHCFGLRTATNVTSEIYFPSEGTVYQDFRYWTTYNSEQFPRGFFFLRYNFPH